MPRIFSPKVILFILFLHMLDICVLPALGAFRPILSYLWILFVAFHWPLKELWPAVLWVGILRDLAGTQPLGVETAALFGVAALLLFFMLKFEREFFLLRLAAGFLFVFLSLCLNLFLSHFISLHSQWTWHALGTCFLCAFWTAILMPFFFAFCGRWFMGEVHFRKQYELFG